MDVSRRKRKKRNIHIYMLYHGEVFLDSRGFTVKLARYTVEARVFMEEKEALVSAVIFVCNAARLDGIRRMKNARCVTLPFLDFCLAGNRRRRERMIYAMKLVKKDESFNLSSNSERTLDVCFD